MNCLSCFYNFSGVCANHTPDPDHYGKSVSEVCGCDYYRCSPWFLSEQEKPNDDIDGASIQPLIYN